MNFEGFLKKGHFNAGYLNFPTLCQLSNPGQIWWRQFTQIIIVIITHGPLPETAQQNKTQIIEFHKSFIRLITLLLNNSIILISKYKQCFFHSVEKLQLV